MLSMLAPRDLRCWCRSLVCDIYAPNPGNLEPYGHGRRNLRLAGTGSRFDSSARAVLVPPRLQPRCHHRLFVPVVSIVGGSTLVVQCIVDTIPFLDFGLLLSMQELSYSSSPSSL